MRYLFLLLLPSLSFGQVIKQASPSPNTGTITPAAITVQNSTFTVAASGIISAPSQPRVRSTRATQVTVNGFNQVYFGADATNTGITHLTTSSDTFTVPTAGDGWYHIECHVPFDAGAGAYRYVEIDKGGVSIVTANTNANASLYGTTTASTDIQLAAADAITCKVYQDTGGALNICNAAACNFTMTKLW